MQVNYLWINMSSFIVHTGDSSYSVLFQTIQFRVSNTTFYNQQTHKTDFCVEFAAIFTALNSSGLCGNSLPDDLCSSKTQNNSELEKWLTVSKLQVQITSTSRNLLKIRILCKHTSVSRNCTKASISS